MSQLKKWNRMGWIVAGCAGLALVISCSYVRDFGHAVGSPTIESLANGGQAFTLDQKDEAAFGRSLAISITNQYKVSEDPHLLAYVNYVGRTLVSVSGTQDRHYVFGVLESEEVGAFSAPDGYVFVTHGAVKLAKDEAELAGVIGHELTHVIHRHGLTSVKEAMVQGTIMQATAAAGINDAMPSLKYLGDIVTKNGYDKKQEYDADQGSVQLLIRAGYDPNSFLNYMKRLDATQFSSGESGGLMSTHPGIHERIGAVAAQIKNAGVIGGATMKDRFNANVSPVTAMAD